MSVCCGRTEETICIRDDQHEVHVWEEEYEVWSLVGIAQLFLAHFCRAH